MQKTKVKKSRITIPVVIIVVVIISLLFIRPIRSIIVMTSMQPSETQEITTDIYSIKNTFVNLYLLKSGDKFILFDAGADKGATESALKAFGISENDIIAIFLTHTDYDHIATIPMLPSADIYMAKSNQTFLTENPSRSKAFIGMDREYITLDDNTTVNIADVEIQCIFTPGHTNGSASYIVNGKYLFVGDNLSLKNGKAGLFDSVFNMSDNGQRESLNKLSKLNNIDYIFTMHYGYTNDFNSAFPK